MLTFNGFINIISHDKTKKNYQQLVWPHQCLFQQESSSLWTGAPLALKPLLQFEAPPPVGWWPSVQLLLLSLEEAPTVAASVINSEENPSEA